MENEKEIKSALPPFRVLDLTEGSCLLGGRMLADLGADVIQIETPGGSASRIAPYYKGIADPEKSLFWFAYSSNKRGITLDLNQARGRRLFKKLVKTADIVLESFEACHLNKMKLGYADQCRIKPDIILASITPFGQTGPKAGYKSSDLTEWASGAFLNACGNPDRAPVWITFSQVGLFGGAEAAIGALTALWHRLSSGEGQYVDVSLQECAIAPTLNLLQMWDVNRVEFRRVGNCMYVSGTGVRQPIYFKCRDGYTMVLIQGGTEPFLTSSGNLVKWMKEDGLAPEWLQKLDWAVDYDAATMGQEIADRVGAAVEKFTVTKTKAELLVEGSIKRGILLAPVNNTKDISDDLQMAARGYWRRLGHPELKTTLNYCGPSVVLSETPIEYKRRAPLIGEHNREIYGGELGIPDEELADLKAQKVI
jgi:benzylsuccinate CoA-transferase BbsE subunit